MPWLVDYNQRKRRGGVEVEVVLKKIIEEIRQKSSFELSVHLFILLL